MTDRRQRIERATALYEGGFTREALLQLRTLAEASEQYLPGKRTTQNLHATFIADQRYRGAALVRAE